MKNTVFLVLLFVLLDCGSETVAQTRSSKRNTTGTHNVSDTINKKPVGAAGTRSTIGVNRSRTTADGVSARDTTIRRNRLDTPRVINSTPSSPTIINRGNSGNTNLNTMGQASIGTGAQTGTYRSGTSASGDVTLPRTSVPGSTISSSSTNVAGTTGPAGSVVNSTAGGVAVSNSAVGTVSTGIGTTAASGPANTNAAGTVHNNGISASSTGAGAVATPPNIDAATPMSAERVAPGGFATTTVPSVVASNFGTAIPGATNVRWSNNRGYWVATYTSGTADATATYSVDGRHIETRTNISLTDANVPSAISIYQTRNTGVLIDKVTRVDKPGATETYELTTRNGRVITINNSGTTIR